MHAYIGHRTLGIVVPSKLHTLPILIVASTATQHCACQPPMLFFLTSRNFLSRALHCQCWIFPSLSVKPPNVRRIERIVLWNNSRGHEPCHINMICLCFTFACHIPPSGRAPPPVRVERIVLSKKKRDFYSTKGLNITTANY